jgi:flagellar motor switch protein FliN/FliY
MTLQDDLRSDREVILAFATALETAIGRDSLFTVGRPRPAIAEIVNDPDARAAALEFDLGGDIAGTIALVMVPAFAATVEGTGADEQLSTAAVGPLMAAAIALATLAQREFEPNHDDVFELSLADAQASLVDDVVVYPILDGTDAVACLVIAIGTRVEFSADAAARPAPLTVPGGASLVLADVEMGVTAELGRSEMTVRELLSITPGAVIDLDRTVGTPVDLLVNGTAIARGEVVIVDEEFGVRITEILASRSSAL